MKARDVMTEGPASVRSTVSLREAISVLESLRVRHLPVIDRKGEIVGILSDRDLRTYSLAEALPELPLDAIAVRLEQPVSQFMSTAVFAVSPDADAEEIANLMIDEQIGAVPVIDSDGTLVGIVSYVDMLRELVPFAPVPDLLLLEQR
jgi:CBS domain-containing protein